jgi:2-aminoethylphosphonate dioxygenase
MILREDVGQMGPQNAAGFWEQGVWHLPGLLEDEAGSLREECERLCAALGTESGNLRVMGWDKLGGGKQFDRLDPVADVSPVIAALARDRRILDAVEAVLGEPAALLKDKLILKSAGVRGYSVHQDYFLWQGCGAQANEVVTVAVAIDRASKENGAVVYYPGRYDQLFNEREEVSDVYVPNSGVVDRKHLEGVAPLLIEAEAGDAVLFTSLIPHESGGNSTDGPRRVIYLTYAPARYGDLRSEYYAGHEAMLRRDQERRGEKLGSLI